MRVSLSLSLSLSLTLSLSLSLSLSDLVHQKRLMPLFLIEFQRHCVPPTGRFPRTPRPLHRLTRRMDQSEGASDDKPPDADALCRSDSVPTNGDILFKFTGEDGVVGTRTIE